MARERRRGHWPETRGGWRWTVSRVLFRFRGEDHSSRPAVAGGLEHSDPDTCSSEELRRTGRPSWCPYSSLLQEGFASPPVTRTARELLPHDFTLAAARAGWRCFFCGTFPEVA